MALTFIVGFAAAAVVLQVIRMVINSWQHSRNAKKLGCGSLPVYPCKDPIGIDTLKQSLAAAKENTVPELAEKRFEIMAEQENRFVTTFMIRNLGRDGIFTIDPKNIQAVLATQFKEFELGDSRRRALHPLLGTGIVSHMISFSRSVWVLTECSSLPMVRIGLGPEVCYDLSSPGSKSVS
jgi:hypothetical protein